MPYLPEPPDIACHPAWDSSIWARSAPALPNRVISLGGGIGEGYQNAAEVSRSSSCTANHSSVSFPVVIPRFAFSTHPYPNSQNSSAWAAGFSPDMFFSRLGKGGAESTQPRL
jgi:hypothetical protein